MGAVVRKICGRVVAHKQIETAQDDVPRCLICGGQMRDSVPYPQQNRVSGGLRFDVIERCGACGLGRAWPYPTQSCLDAFYSSGGYWHEVIPRSRAQVLHEKNQCYHRVRTCIPYLESRRNLRVLDIGAGHGWTADWLHRLMPGGMAAFEFVEPDEVRSREILERSFPFPVSRVADVGGAAYGYDLVFANHVLEHVADPVVFITAVARVMKPGGVLYVETPHSDYQFKSDVFPHMFFFTREALSALAKRVSFGQVLCEVFGDWPLSTNSGAVSRLKAFLLRHAYSVSAAAGVETWAYRLDDRVWRYRARDDGIWVRCLLQKQAGEQALGIAPPSAGGSAGGA